MRTPWPSERASPWPQVLCPVRSSEQHRSRSPAKARRQELRFVRSTSFQRVSSILLYEFLPVCLRSLQQYVDFFILRCFDSVFSVTAEVIKSFSVVDPGIGDFFDHWRRLVAVIRCC